MGESVVGAWRQDSEGVNLLIRLFRICNVRRNIASYREIDQAALFALVRLGRITNEEIEQIIGLCRSGANEDECCERLARLRGPEKIPAGSSELRDLVRQAKRSRRAAPPAARAVPVG